MREYKYQRQDGYSGNLELPALMTVAQNRVEPGHLPYIVTMDGDVVSGQLTRQPALDRFKFLIQDKRVGPVFRIRDDRDVQFTARAVFGLSDADSTSGNERADIFWNWIRSEWGRYDPRYAGAYVCKSASQHRFGNAVDVFFDTLTHQDEVAHEVVRMANLLNPYHVISLQRIWTKGVGWHPHTGEFHGHLHVDFDPNFDLGLPCGLRGIL